MRVTITTDGGFTGRGIGSASADDDEVRIALDAADPSSWDAEYTTRGADIVRYTLTAGPYSVRWMEGAAIPEDLRRLFEAVWGKR